MRFPADGLAKLFRDAGRAHHAAFNAGWFRARYSAV
jgi:hypothetical protein